MHRATDEAKVRAIKLATGQLVSMVGGIEAAGGLLKRGKSTVHRWTDINDAEHFINVADAARLEALAGETGLTELLCRAAGGVFVPHLDVTADEGTPAWLAMQLAQRLGQVSGEIAAALANDGTIDAAEAARVMAVQDGLDRASAQLRGLLQGVVNGRAGQVSGCAGRDNPPEEVNHAGRLFVRGGSKL